MGSTAAQLVGESGASPWHFHPEFELILIVAGSGLRLIGDDVGVFTAGEVVLLAPDCPHSWVSTSSPRDPAKAAVIHFSRDLASLATAVPDSTSLLALFQTARRGAIMRNVVRETLDSIERIARRSRVDPKSLGLLLEILAALAESDVDTLSSSVAQPPAVGQERIEKIRAYLLEYHTQPVTLAQAAGIAVMNPAAFSRFFHKAMGRPFTRYLSELRVHHACALLLDSDLAVIDVSAAAGFANLSNFNRRFRQYKGTTPSAYRRDAQIATAPRRGQRLDR